MASPLPLWYGRQSRIEESESVNLEQSQLDPFGRIRGFVDLGGFDWGLEEI